MKSYMDIWLSAPTWVRNLLNMFEWTILIGTGLLIPKPGIPSYFFIRVIGMMLILTGLLLHKLSHSIHIQAHQPKEKIEKLVTSGIYSRIRHPCYLEIILYYFGLFLLIGSLSMLVPISLFIFILYDSIIKEEKFLEKRFGKEYEEYVKKVPWRFIPRIF